MAKLFGTVKDIAWKVAGLICLAIIVADGGPMAYDLLFTDTVINYNDLPAD